MAMLNNQRVNEQYYEDLFGNNPLASQMVAVLCQWFTGVLQESNFQYQVRIHIKFNGLV